MSRREVSSVIGDKVLLLLLLFEIRRGETVEEFEVSWEGGWAVVERRRVLRLGGRFSLSVICLRGTTLEKKIEEVSTDLCKKGFYDLFI